MKLFKLITALFIAAVFLTLAGCPSPVNETSDNNQVFKSDLSVYQGTTFIANGSGVYGFGEISADGNNLTASGYVTFTLKNEGLTDCVLIGTTKDSTDFDMTTPSSPVAANGGTKNFTIRFDPLSLGVKSATVTIAFTNPDPKYYTFTITGTGVPPQPELNMYQVIYIDDEETLVPMTNGQTIDMGTKYGVVNEFYVFKIINTGDAVLTLDSYWAVPYCSFYTLPDVTSLPRDNGKSTFQIKFFTNTPGTVTGSITFVTNDADRSPFVINFTAFVIIPEE